MVNITMKLFLALGFLSLLAGCVSINNPFACYLTDTIRYVPSMMAGLTSYEAIRRYNFTAVNPYNSNCNSSRLWYLGRHGARFPLLNLQQQMIDFAQSTVKADIVNNYEAGRTSLCQPDFEAIRDFIMDTDFGNITNAALLMESGAIAMQNIAKRLQQRFPHILTQTYSPDRFHFRHTSTQRTNGSLRAFAKGLFGNFGSRNVIYENVPATDWLLRPLDFCPVFSQEIVNYTDTGNAFREGPESEEMIQQINRKLGFHTSNQLNSDQIDGMYLWCRYQTAALFETSNSEIGGYAPWCAPFSIAHHRLREYAEDVDFFYHSGYGVRNQRLLENLMCGLMQDLLTHMQSNNSKKARIFVTESHDVLAMLALLGAFRDVWSLNQHNYAEQSARRWRSTLLAAFSTNIVVVRYDCNRDDDLIFLLNEKPMLVPGCDQQSGVCKLSVFVNQFKRFITANCPVYFCSNN